LTIGKEDRMTLKITRKTLRMSRRRFLSTATATGVGVVAMPYLSRAADRPVIKTAPIRNTVWLTADVHYASAHYYNPDKAQFQDFEPFWEFVSGPLHAIRSAPTSSTTPSVPR
jgi:PhoD-like phosphatase